MVEATPQDCLIVVDVQIDFCPGGALPVAHGNHVVPVINGLLPHFACLVFSRDWHPPDHMSFSKHAEFRDGSWPPHCVPETEGARFHPDLMVPENALIVSKATKPDREEYSGFQAGAVVEAGGVVQAGALVEPGGVDLAGWLRDRGVERVFVTGLATDYCVRQTALDARAEGFEVWLVEDATGGVALETTARALVDLDRSGVKRINSEEIE